MSRPALEVADIFRDHGAAWRKANAGHVSLGQMKVMTCDQALPHGGARRACCALREREVRPHRDRLQQLPQPALPQVSGRCRTRVAGRARGGAACRCRTSTSCTRCLAAIADIAYQNKAVIYDLLFKASAETTLKIAADAQASRRSHRLHVGAAHVGFRADASPARPHGRAGRRPVARTGPSGYRADRDYFLCRARFSRRCSGGCSWRCCCAAHEAGRLRFFGDHAGLADARSVQRLPGAAARDRLGASTRRSRSADPRQVLRYLSRYTHRVAISNRRLIAADQNGVTFKYKDYRDRRSARRYTTMTLDTARVHPPLPDARAAARASIASATTDCSPTATAPPTSHARASCSRCRLA